MPRIPRSLAPAATLLLAVAALTACASPPRGIDGAADGLPADEPVADVVALGEPFETTRGQVFVLRIQDEYRVIRCIPDGPIAGCYEDVFSVADSDLEWSEWMDVTDVPGLRVAFVSPTAVALIQGPPDAAVDPPPAAE